MLAAMQLPAQWLRDIPDYSCVHNKKSVLHCPANCIALDGFYRSLDSLLLYGGKGVRILHIGGSHVQADILPHRLRLNFAALGYNITASRGVLFPMHLCKTNASPYYTITATGTWDYTTLMNHRLPLQLGLTGMAALTTDTATLNIRLNNHSDEHWNFNTMHILGAASSDSVQIYTILDGDTLYALPDSIDGYVLTLTQPTDTLLLHFDVPENNRFILNGLLPANDAPGVSYYSIGVNGAAVPSWLNTNFEHQLRLIQPQLVIFGIGINDANVPYGKFDTAVFKAGYNELIRRIHLVSPNCAFIFITNNDCYTNLGRRHRSSPNRNTLLAQQAFYELARQHNAAVWDTYEVMGGLGSSNQWRDSGLMRRDRIHFSTDGYKLIGDLLFNAIIERYRTHANNYE